MSEADKQANKKDNTLCPDCNAKMVFLLRRMTDWGLIDKMYCVQCDRLFWVWVKVEEKESVSGLAPA